MPWARLAMASIPVVLPELRRRGRLLAGGKAASVAGCAVAVSCLAPVPELLAAAIPAGIQQPRTTLPESHMDFSSRETGRPCTNAHFLLSMQYRKFSHME